MLGVAAIVLLAAFALLAPSYFVAVRWRLAPARPELVWLFALMPLSGLLLAIRAGARTAVVVAALELAACVPLHGLITFIHAWRLD